MSLPVRTEAGTREFEAMGISGRRLGDGPAATGKAGRARFRLALVLAVMAALPATAVARDVTVTGTPMNRFGRLVLKFERPTKVTARATNGVLVIGFADPNRVARERLATELPGYVSAVRRDPDDTGLRIALSGVFKPNLMEAGERVFIDLLPANWSGLPPGLPPEIVAELAERARTAEAKLRGGETARREEAPKPVALRASELPNMTRFVFEPPAGTPVRIRDDGGLAVLEFDGSLSLDQGAVKPRAARGVAEFTVRRGDARLGVTVGPAEGYFARAFQEDGTVVLDLSRPAKEPAPLPPPLPPRSKPAVAAEPEHETPKTVAQDKSAATPAAAKMEVAKPAEPPKASPDASPAAPVGEGPRASAPAAPGMIKASVERSGETISVTFPFSSQTPAAAFERGGEVTLLFETPDRIEWPSAEAGQPVLTGDVKQEPGFAVIRLPSPPAGPMRLVAEGSAWRLVMGESSALPPDAVTVVRSADINGQGRMTIGLAATSPARWIRDPTDGARIAVVATAGRPQAIAAARRFVDFELPATLGGVAVEALRDDLVVTPGAAGIVITAPAGLSLSDDTAARADDAQMSSPLLLTRDGWAKEVGGDTFRRYHELLGFAADAPRSGRSEARVRLARFLLAQGMNVEAGSVLAITRVDDPVIGTRREALLLSGIAAVRAGRLKEARALLSTTSLGEDPEAKMWRAVLDAREGQPRTALEAILKSSQILRRYPDVLVGEIRMAALNAALALGQTARAEAELAALDRLPGDVVPRDEYDLARARTDEAAGRPVPAVKAYERLADEASRPIAAEATRRFVSLAGRLGKLDPDSARRRLEGLAVAWRGDDTELGAIADLARMHEKAGRWREMLSTTRLASRQFPDREVTRTLYDEAAQVFERLLLGAESAKLGPVETLSLYYDFKEFAPIGRRGDEIVRRLADRLVELDLLTQAADLLQYQVDARLTGAARAAVAARLAAVRLMNNQPVQALAALHATRLAELPSQVRRSRLLLEARALADMTRIDLALEVTEGEEGADIARLRANIFYGARRWREAGETGEALLGLRWKEGGALSDRERMDVLRAGVAYVLGAERIDLERLGQKFAAKMSDSPDSKAFDVLMRADAVDSRDFRRLALDVARQDGLRELLRDLSAMTGAPGSGAAANAAPDRAG